MTQPALKPKPEPDTTPTTKTITGTLYRHRRTRGHSFEDQPPAPPPEPVRRPARVAVMLALAWKIQDAIDRGVVESRAEVAERLGWSRARVTQIMDLMLLAPDIQEGILELEAADGREPVTERGLRDVLKSPDWQVQRGQLDTLCLFTTGAS